MSTAPARSKREMPKGGRKGGAMFPRMSLGDILPYAKKLVSKTHTAAQSMDVILMGVFGSRHDKGKYGMSAAKQYGLMGGDSKTKFSATDLAKKIAAAPEEEHAGLYRQAALKPAIFKALFETYHGDTVPKARLKQRAADLNVHPEETATCVELYVSTMVTAGLASLAGDQVSHVASSDLSVSPSPQEMGGDDTEVETDREVAGEGAEQQALAGATQGAGPRQHGMVDPSTIKPNGDGLGARAVFHVNVTLDSSLDTEKLQKQLELLKRFGAL